MGTVGKWETLLLCALVTLGFLYSPVCKVGCALSDCSLSPATTRPETAGQPGHCHQNAEPPGQPSTSGENPSPHQRNEDSGKCPNHIEEPALFRAIAAATLEFHQSQTLSKRSADQASLWSGDLTAKLTRGRQLRSPPERAVISVYRI
jgi:hypothetical protein